MELESDDLYRDLKSIKSYFDFSRYPTNHPLYSTENQGVPGKFRSETNEKMIREFVGLRAKAYSVLLEDGTTKSAAAGTVKDIAAQKLTHERYRHVLEHLTDLHVEQTTLRSINHRVVMLTCNKLSLSAYDDKRFYVDSINSHAYNFGNT